MKPCKQIARAPHHRGRRGISLLETVIALVVIAIISAAALTLIVSHSKIEADAVNEIEIANAAENAVECFRYADDLGVLSEALQKTDHYTKTEDDGFTLQKGSYTILLTVDFNTNTLTISACDTNGDIIYTTTYTKG